MSDRNKKPAYVTIAQKALRYACAFRRLRELEDNRASGKGSFLPGGPESKEIQGLSDLLDEIRASITDEEKEEMPNEATVDTMFPCHKNDRDMDEESFTGFTVVLEASFLALSDDEQEEKIRLPGDITKSMLAVVSQELSGVILKLQEQRALVNVLINDPRFEGKEIGIKTVLTNNALYG